MTEPCPFCGARMTPVTWGDVKKCTACGRMWRESGGGLRNPRTGGGPGSSSGAMAAPQFLSMEAR